MKNNPVAIIKKDHQTVEKLFKDYEKLGDDAVATKRKLADQIVLELTTHAEMEEALCYPRFKEAFTKDEDKMVDEAYAEHAGVKRILEDLQSLEPDQPEFDANVTVLMEQVRHHVKEEEKEILPVIEKEIGKEELADMGDEMIVFKESRV